jgi:hypothetical protein
MLQLNDQKIQVLHLEPTDACNAACPQCLRETDITFDKNDLHHLTVEQIKSIVDVDTIKNLDKMFMCGDYGDPAAGKHTLEIYRYFRSINPTITLGMNTNGGLRNIDWWQEIASTLNQPRDYVVFSIDGLEDTNHIYRVNVKWAKVLENAQAFIRAGGIAHWEMLVFEYNQHQVEQAQQMAKELGFKWFRAKITKRYNIATVGFLQPPKGWVSPVVTDGIIDCLALNDRSVYISAKGMVYPCCWLGANTKYTLDTFNDVQQSWATFPNDICKATCTKNAVGTSFTNQWQKEIGF